MNQVPLVTRVLDPVYHSNTRTRVKLNCLNNGLLPNLRVIDVGLSGVVAGAGTNYYKASAGALSTIKRMYLSEKGNPIQDLTTKAPNWCTFVNLLDSQSNSAAVRTFSLKSRRGVGAGVLVRDPAIDTPGQLKRENPNVDGTQNIVSCESDIDLAQPYNSARLDLQQYFNFLKSEDLLVGFKDLELTIEWQTEASKIFDDVTGAGYPTGWTVNEPRVVFEEILDKDFVQKQAMAKRGTKTTFLTPELEFLRVPSTASNNPITTKLRLNGFKNKILHKLLIATGDDLLGDSVTEGDCQSRVQNLEEWQVYVNNSQLFNYVLDTPSRKLAFLQDSFGKSLCSWFENRWDYANPGEGWLDPTISATLDAFESGLNSYFGCDIKDFISDLRIEFTRTRDNVTGGSAADLTLNCFGIVEKTVHYGKNGEVVISYLP